MDRPAPLVAAFREARSRVFGRGFDRAFRFVLSGAYVVGALLIAHRGGGLAPLSVIVGAIAMALFIAIPLALIFVYVVAISFFARLTGTGEQDDPNFGAVAAAFVLTLAIAFGVVGAAAHIPIVGAQLRAIFA
jgi:hypothetical protein